VTVDRSEARKPTGWQEALVAWWESLEPIWRDKGLGPATKLAYAWLWLRAGSRPGRVVVTHYQLGAAFGRTHRAADKWIEPLKERGLVDLVDHDRITGALTLYVNAPGELIRPRPTRQEQPSLPGMEDDVDPTPEQPDTIAIQPQGLDVSAQKRPDVSAQKRPDVSAQKRPTPQREPTPRAQSLRFVSLRNEQGISGETIRSQWPRLRPTFRKIVNELHPEKTDLAERDRELFVRLAVLAADHEGAEWLDFALKRVREARPRNRIGHFVNVLAYTLHERETGRHPRTADAKAEARHRLGGLLRKIHVPLPDKPKPREPDAEEDVEQVPTAEEREVTRQYLREHGPRRYRPSPNRFEGEA